MQPGSASTGAGLLPVPMLQVQMLLPSEAELIRAARGMSLSIVSKPAQLARVKNRCSTPDSLRGLF